MLIGAAALMWLGGGESLAIRPIGIQEVDELSPLELTIEVESPETSSGPLRFELRKAPDGARIDGRTGRLSWTPGEEHGPGVYEVVVRVVGSESSELRDDEQFSVFVKEMNRPPVLEPIEDKSIGAEEVWAYTARAADPDLPARRLNFRLLPGAPHGARINADTGEIRWNPRSADPQEVHRFAVRVTEAIPGGLSATQEFAVRLELPAEAADGSVAGLVDDRGPQIADAEPPDGPPMEASRESSSTASEGEQDFGDALAAASALDAGDKKLIELCKANRLFLRNQYPTLRKIFAERFQKEHQAAVAQAFGEADGPMQRWLDEHPEIKEEFFTAINPEHDDVTAVLRLFREIWERFPAALEKYPNLAIATAVTWDRPRKGVYDYVGHQRRTKSRLPDQRVGAMENFETMIGAEKFMQLLAEFLPWEFLVHVVNHKTPLAERAWARANYAPKIAMYGKCYKDVPYDTEMLDSGSKTARLNDKDYTLPNIRHYGGVCAMQADFAARVGKSMGVPAAYVGGKSRFGESHAWVMWVELGNVTSSAIQFSLQSAGRYRNDKYYVGNLHDPQTGQGITDRQLELRLQTVGMNPQAKRHAALIMHAYPMLRDRTEMGVTDQLMFLYKVIDLCPGNEQAWIAMAQMSRDGVVTKQHNKAMLRVLDKLYLTFADFPDFTWVIFDDLMAYQDVPKQRAKHFGKLLFLYVQAGRPDLACKARLKLTEYLVKDGKRGEAVEGLQVTIMAFPTEGRYVPKMLDKLEEICRQDGGNDQELAAFYQVLLPKIPKRRGSRPSPYCIKMYERGVALFSRSGPAQAAEFYEAQLALLKASKRG